MIQLILQFVAIRQVTKHVLLPVFVEYPKSNQTLLKWFLLAEKSCYFKFSVLIKNIMCSRFLSHRVTMFSKRVGRTASDWPVSGVATTSQIDRFLLDPSSLEKSCWQCFCKLTKLKERNRNSLKQK